jgi:hypothetical protein
MSGPLALFVTLGLSIPVSGLFQHRDASPIWYLGASIAIGGTIGFAVNRRKKDRSATLVWIPGCILFLEAARETASSWSLELYHRERWDFVMNALFGPDCAFSECTSVLPTVLMFLMLGYSLGAYLSLDREVTAPL